MKKQFVSLNEALNFLQFMNADKQAFEGKNFIAAEPKQLKTKKNLKSSIDQKQRKHIQRKQGEQIKSTAENGDVIEEGTGGRKLVNKNRAIKRIIETSKQILESNYRWVEPPPDEKKSHITQFNIYLKQYNRLCQQIIAQEKEREQQVRNYIDQQEDILQNVYLYTVCEDFREVLQVSILKDKINKTNIDMIMQTFKDCLIVLRTNELKIHDSPQQDSPHRDIKLHEIENVDYFSQPYIFTVMTIIKDKTVGQEFLCIRFDSHERQHKWDRAVYCNYITRKMKRKNRYFLYQFPEKEDEKENNEGREHIAKKRDDIKSYEVDKKKIIRNLTSQTEKQKEKQQTRMGTLGMDTTERDFPSTQKRGGLQRFNTGDQIKLLIPVTQSSPFHMASKNSQQKPYFQSSNMRTSKRKDEIIVDTQNKQDPKTIEKQRKDKDNFQDPKQNSVNLLSSKSPTNKMQEIRGSQSSVKSFRPENILNINKIVSSQMSLQSQQAISKKSEIQIVNPDAKRKIQLKQKHKEGIVVKKAKFFNDKPKLIYLNSQELTYWDFDEKTMHKYEKKIIYLKDLKAYTINTKKSIIVFELATKTLQFMGKIEDINDIAQWIQLQKRQKQQMMKSIKLIESSNKKNGQNEMNSIL